MSDQQDIWASIREKLSLEEKLYLDNALDKQTSAWQEVQNSLTELQTLLSQAKENNLDIATDQFSQEIEDHERESAGSWQPRFDPDFILEDAEVEIVAGNIDTTFITNESATEFIEKYLLLAWTALKNADHLSDEAAPGLLHNQDPGDTTMDIIAECVGQVSALNGLTEDGILTIA